MPAWPRTASRPRASPAPPRSAASPPARATRQLGTRAANVDARRGGPQARARAPPPRGGRADRHRARDDEGRGDEARPGAVASSTSAWCPRSTARSSSASSASCATRRPRSRFKDMRKVIESELGEPLDERLRRVRRGADRRRLDRPGLPRDAARRPRRRGQGPVPAASPQAVRADMQNLGMILRLMKHDRAGPRRQGARPRRSASASTRSSTTSSRRPTSARWRASSAATRSSSSPRSSRRLSRERVLVTEFVEGAASRTIKALRPGRRATASARSSSASTSAACTATASSPATRTPATSCCCDDGRVAFLDFGLFKRMPRELVELELACQRAGAEGDAERAHEHLDRDGLPRATPSASTPTSCWRSSATRPGGT